MTKATRDSYLVITTAIVLMGWLGLSTPFITIFFSYFALAKLHFTKRKWLTVTLFLALVAGICGGLAYFIHQAIHTLPRVATTSVPLAIKFAEDHGWELPFSDWASLKEFAMDSIKGVLPYVGNAARATTKQFVFIIIGVIIAVGIFLNPRTSLEPESAERRNNLYLAWSQEITERFRGLYHSFAEVMGAQLVIATINTGLTAIFITCVGLPHASLVIIATFICGLLPIIGNLISNSIIVGIAITVSPSMAAYALIFLVILHKLEYFLNSKIIGERIKNPVWLTLIALIVGERFLGVAGMILAPVILNYIKIEASQITVMEPPKRP